MVHLTDDQGVTYYYAHLRTWSAKLLPEGKQGVRVQAGEQLGTVGSSGNAKGKDPHLHFTMRRGQNVIDPYDSLVRVDPKRGLTLKTGAAMGLGLFLAWWAFRRSLKHGW